MKTRLFLVALGMAALCLLLLPVPSHALLDLTSGGSGTINGALFVTVDQAPTGSGVIDSFVRISTNGTVEEGYNTSGRPLQFDENTSPTFTHDLLLTAVPIVNIGGIDYREFLLDINQQSSHPLLSLDEVLVYQSPTGGLHTNFPTGFGTLVYDLDGAGNNYVLLDYNLNSGSGSGDMFMYIRNDLFGAGAYVYLYSRFGENNINNDGYEEWAVQKPGPSVPEPATMLLVGTGLVGLVGLGRRRNRKS